MEANINRDKRSSANSIRRAGPRSGIGSTAAPSRNRRPSRLKKLRSLLVLLSTQHHIETRCCGFERWGGKGEHPAPVNSLQMQGLQVGPPSGERSGFRFLSRRQQASLFSPLACAVIPLLSPATLFQKGLVFSAAWSKHTRQTHRNSGTRIGHLCRIARAGRTASAAPCRPELRGFRRAPHGSGAATERCDADGALD
jgi:hypothetical protein